MKNRTLKKWEEETESLAKCFINKYFGSSKDVEYYWISEEVGGVLVVNDYFFGINEIVDFLRFHYPKEKMFEYYNYALAYNMTEKHKKDDYLINIKHYIKI